MVPREDYIRFFNAYEDLRKNLQFRPEFIINIDETMVDVITSPDKVILFKDDSNPVVTEAKKLEHITLLLSLPAAGDPIRPLAILPLITVPDLNNDVKQYYDLSGQSTGWINGSILEFWLENQFLRQMTERRAKYDPEAPILVILDNHSSRNTINQDRMWNEHKIKFLFIPAHTSHVVQPLDKCPNVMYKRLLHNGYEPHPDDTANIRRNRVLLASIPALQTALSPSYRDSGWRATGLYPYHRERILEGELVPRAITDEKPILPDQPKQKTQRFQVGNKKKGEVVQNFVYTLG
jgi:hypothetical protein